MKIRSLLKTLLFAFSVLKDIRDNQSEEKSSSGDTGGREDLRVEYQEIGANMRFYAHQRFWLWPVFLAFNLALAAFLWGPGCFTMGWARSVFMALAAGVAGVFLAIEYSAVAKGRGLKRRARNIEDALDLRTEGAAADQNAGQYNNATGPSLCPSVLTRWFYGLTALAWVAAFVASLFCASPAACPWVLKPVEGVAFSTSTVLEAPAP